MNDDMDYGWGGKLMGAGNEPPTWFETSGKAVARLVPVVGSSLSAIFEDILARHRSRGASVVDDIMELVPDADSIQGRLAENEQVEFIFIDGVEIAVRSGFAGKRRLLARVVARAIDDDARIDESQLILHALRDLDAPHLRALARIRAAQNAALADVPVTEGEGVKGRIASEAASRAGQDEPLPIRAALLRSGVVYNSSSIGGGPSIGRISEFGEALLYDLDRVNAWS